MPRGKALKKKPTATTRTPKVQAKMVSSKPSGPNLLTQKKVLYPLIVIIVLIALAFGIKGVFIAALVNGQPISRLSIIAQLEKQGGKQILNDMITQTLVLREAQKENITVSQGEVNTQVKVLQDNMTKQGQNLDQLLSAQNLTRRDLEDRIRLQQIVTKKFGKTVSVSEKEIDDYVTANKDSIPDNTNMDEYRAKAKEQLRQQKLQQKVQSWITQLQKNAKITYFVSY